MDVSRTLPGASAEFQRENPAEVDGAGTLPVAPPEASDRSAVQTGCKRPEPAEAPDSPATTGSRASEPGNAAGAHSCGFASLPADLRAVAEAWPRLPEAVRAGIMAMVKTTVE